MIGSTLPPPYWAMPEPQRSKALEVARRQWEANERRDRRWLIGFAVLLCITQAPFVAMLAAIATGRMGQ